MILYLVKDKEKSLCKIIQKLYTLGKLLVIFEDNDLKEKINKMLWTFSQKAFIPHGSNLDDLPELQPVYLTTTCENINNAKNLLLVDTFDYEMGAFENIFIVSDKEDKMRKLYSSNPEIKLFIQNEDMGWTKCQ